MAGEPTSLTPYQQVLADKKKQDEQTYADRYGRQQDVNAAQNSSPGQLLLGPNFFNNIRNQDNAQWNTDDARNNQIFQARAFRAQAPDIEQNMASDLRGQSSQNMYGLIHKNKWDMAKRGMQNSGLAAATEGAIRAQGQAQYGAGVNKIHSGLMSAADAYDQQAANTGLQIQQTQQDIQNNIYAQAWASVNSQNAMIGSIAGAAATAAIFL